MIFFITFLRAMAACLITNSHYSEVYPISALANGGLLGNVLFFAISGYCLCNANLSFPRWYARRLIRMYPAVWIVIGICFALGTYEFAERSATWWLIFPTYYHFIGSIALLYIPFYFLMRFPVFRERLPLVIAGVALAWICVYLFAYDRSRYHIDTVREPMIRFLFMECMLIGAWFRLNDARFRNNFRAWKPILLVALLGVYFASKVALTKYAALAPYQIGNQIVLVGVVFATFLTCAGLDAKLERTPKPIKSVITLLSTLTLEIYVVQYRALIDWLSPIGRFPLNWLVLSGAILLGAYLLHIVCNRISVACDKLIMAGSEPKRR